MQKKSMMMVGIVILVVVAIVVVMRVLFGATAPLTFQNQNQTETLPSAAVAEVESTVAEVTSLEGTFKLTLKKMVNKNEQTQTYTLFTSKSDTPIFTKTVGLSGAITVPGNSWSPDNKYVYIEETDGEGIKNYLVLKASGEPVAKDQPYYDVRTLFTAKKIKYTFNKVTGWASPTLLIIYTINDQSTKGPSFWFEIPSKAFLQLAH
jgi:hypothetical protein